MQQLGEQIETQQARLEGDEAAHGGLSDEYYASLERLNSAIQELDQYQIRLCGLDEPPGGF